MRLSCRIGRVLSLLLVAALLLTGCFARSGQNNNGNGNGKIELKTYAREFIAMSTVVTVRFSAEPDYPAELVFDAVYAELQRLEDILSAHNAHSDVSKIDAAAGVGPVPVNPETIEVIKVAIEYAELTHDTFDITLAPVLRLYNFGEETKTKPSRWQLETTLPLVNWRNVEVNQDAGTVFLTEEGMKMDLGGIAKGYIVDRAADILRDYGFKYGLINAGGDISVLGPKQDGTAWRVGIKNPGDPGDDENPGTFFAIVEINGGAIVTSGDYERYFDKGDVRYHHIINPETGLPASEVRSVTVIAPTATLADLLSTAVFVMGAESGLALIESLPGVDVVIWDKDGVVTNSSGLNNNQELADQAGVDYYFR